MAKQTSPHHTSWRHTRRLSTYLRRHWLLLGVIAFFVAVALAGAPAWAAPAPRPLNQTVPRPTPTSPGDPVATATPRPDLGQDEEDDEDTGGSTGGGSTGGGGGNLELDTSLPNELMEDGEALPAPGSESTGSGAPSSADLTANVTVGQLNVRAQPTTGANVLGSLTANQQVTVEARNEDGTWWYICCLADGDTRGWVSAQFMTPSFARAQANDLLPVFGAAATATPAPTATPPPPAQAQKADSPLELDFKIDPPFLWQGITGTLTITVTNPNSVDVVRAELSDELPPTMRFIDAEADAGGTVSTTTTATGNTLLLFRWAQIPGTTSVAATVNFRVAETLEDGAVFDNLVGIQARNAGYNSGAITIGMPPVLPPSFD